MNKKRAALFVAVAAFLLIPVIDKNQYHIYILDRALINCIVASGLVALTGLAGQMSLGHAAFYGIGAYTSALLTAKLGLPIWLGISAAAFICLAAGMLLGVPSFKVSGFYLSLVTISFGNIVWMVIINWQSLTGGPLGFLGIPTIRLGGNPIGKIGFFYLSAAVLALTFAVSRKIAGSYLGRAMRAMRDDEVAATTTGINVKALKLMVFSLSAVYGGIAGGLYAHLSTFLSPESFVFLESCNFVAMAVVGGLRHIFGGILGGLVVTLIPEFLRVKGWEIYYLMGSSLVILLLVIYLPSGLVPAIDNAFNRLFGSCSGSAVTTGGGRVSGSKVARR